MLTRSASPSAVAPAGPILLAAAAARGAAGEWLGAGRRAVGEADGGDGMDGRLHFSSSTVSRVLVLSAEASSVAPSSPI